MKNFLSLRVLLAILAAGAFFVLRQKTGLVLDSKEILARADRMLPGAWPPEGLEAAMALQPEEDLEVVIFAPSAGKVWPSSWEPGDLRIVLARPAVGKELDAAQLKARIQKAQQKKAEETEELEKGPVVLSVGGQPYPGLEITSRLRSNQVALRENITVLKGEATTIVLFSGPQEGFPEKTRDAFLNVLEPPRIAPPLPPVAGGGEKRPGTRPGPGPARRPGKNERLLREAQQAAGDAVPIPAGVNPDKIPHPDANKFEVDRGKLPPGIGF